MQGTDKVPEHVAAAACLVGIAVAALDFDGQRIAAAHEIADGAGVVVRTGRQTISGVDGIGGAWRRNHHP